MLRRQLSDGQEAALHQSAESGNGPEELVWWDLATGGLECGEMLDNGVGNTGYWDVY
jgi:hypothetical protein